MRCFRSKTWVISYLVASVDLPPRKRFDMYGGGSENNYLRLSLAAQGLEKLRIGGALVYMGMYSLDHEQHSEIIFSSISNPRFKSLVECRSVNAILHRTVVLVCYSTGAWTYFRKQ